MNHLPRTLTLVCALAASQAFAWSNHSVPAYRALEKMPEVAQAAPVTAEPLENFLKDQEKPIEALLAAQESWAQANIASYPARPAALAFNANPAATDDARRLAFFTALRIAPNSRFALYVQPDPAQAAANTPSLPYNSVNTLPEQPNSPYVFKALQAGDKVPPLHVVASAADEPDYGLDINLWEDSPSDWGKVYGFGTLPFGNPTLYYSTQAPFHMGFFHESGILYMAAPFLKRTLPQLRVHQYSTLAELAFRSGHPYWGWRFTGLALHYVQDLTQPYHARLAPGESTLKLLFANILAMIGMPSMKDNMIVLLSNRHLALEKYQAELLALAASNSHRSEVEKALRDASKDTNYPSWGAQYARDVVSAQSATYSDTLVKNLLSAMPEAYVSDPAFDFGVKEAGINLEKEVAQGEASQRQLLDSSLVELLGNFGAHSRNTVRGILQASQAPAP